MCVDNNVHLIGLGFLGCSNGKESSHNAGDLGSIPGLGRSPGNPLQYSRLENPMDRGAWWATVQGSQRIGHNRATSLSRDGGGADILTKASYLVFMRGGAGGVDVRSGQTHRRPSTWSLMLCGLYLEILFIFFKLEITDNFIFECVLAHECNGTMEPAPRGLEPLLTGRGASHLPGLLCCLLPLLSDTSLLPGLRVSTAVIK